VNIEDEVAKVNEFAKPLNAIVEILLLNTQQTMQ
jgi:hypothetical protein